MLIVIGPRQAMLRDTSQPGNRQSRISCGTPRRIGGKHLHTVVINNLAFLIILESKNHGP